MNTRSHTLPVRLLCCLIVFSAVAHTRIGVAESRDVARKVARRTHQPPRAAAAADQAIEETQADPQTEPAESIPQRKYSATTDDQPLPPIYSDNHAPPLEPGWNVEYCGPACDAEGSCGNGYCGPNVYWGRVEFLLWWTKGMELPPLVSTDVLPQGEVLFGGDTIGDERRPGGRGTLGIWMDDCHTWGVGVKVSALGSQSNRFNSEDANQATVGRPFLELIAPQQAQEQILIVNGISPALGQVAGNVTAEADADLFVGEIFIRHELQRTDYRRIDLLIGYQGSQIEEELRIRHASAQVQGNASFSALDEFTAISEFHGGEIGFVVEYMTDRWMLEAIAKVGLGDMHQQVTISGESLINGAPGAGGFLALDSNSGVFGKNEFSVVPEVNLTLGYFATDRMLISFGYSFIHWNNVVQVGDQIDRVINPALLPGPGQIPGADPQRPRFRFNESDYFAHGISFGVQFLF